MKITWLGHAGFRIEMGGAVLLIDPWLSGNPMFPESRRAEAIAGATHVLLTHGHFDHAADAGAIARERGVPLVGQYDLVTYIAGRDGAQALGFNLGGTVRLGEVAVTLVRAAHSSSLAGPDGAPVAVGSEAGFMLAHGGRTIYVSGDTDVMADMALFHELHAPEVGILCAGGLYTMDMARAAFAARRFFRFKTVIPCHYRTFPALEQSAEALKAGLPGVAVVEPEVLVPITL